jgi:hypothetical protein
MFGCDAQRSLMTRHDACRPGEREHAMINIHNKPVAQRIEWLFELADRHGTTYRSPEASA